MADSEERLIVERRGEFVGDSASISFTTKELFMEIKRGQDTLTNQMSNLQANGSSRSQETAKDVYRLEERVRLLENTSASQAALSRMGIAVALAILTSAGTWVTLLLRMK